jgi:type II secretory pathway component PulM
MNQLWQRLSKRERSLVISTVVIIVVVLARYALIGPFVERREWVSSQLEIQPQLLEKNLRFLGQKEELVAMLEATQSELKAREPKLLTGDTPSVSASDLQDVIQGLATKEGTQVITTRVLNPETAGNFAKISIQMEIGGQIDQLASLIRGIENSPKLLMVDEINVRSLFRPAGFPQPQGAPQLAAQNLRVSLTVSGLARSQTSAASKSESAPSQSKGASSKTNQP